MIREKTNERYYIGCITLVTAILALVATWCVLQLAWSSTSSDAIETNAFGEKNFASTSEGTKTTKDTANTLLILLDDAGWGDFSFHSTDPYYSLSTPNMDKLMSEGLYFSNYYTQSLCTPARASLMTGRWTWVLGLQKRNIFSTCMDARLSYDYPTYAELLSQRDYTNYFYGKWHLGMDSWLSTPRGRGFDQFVGSFTSGGGGGFIEEKGGWHSMNATWACDKRMADQTLTAWSYTQCLMESWDFSYTKYDSTTGTCISWSASTVPTACEAWNPDVPDYIQSYLLSEGEYIHLDIWQNSLDWWRDTSPDFPKVQKHSDLVLADEAIATLEGLSLEDDWSMILAFKTPHQDPAYLPNGTNTPAVNGCSRYFDKSGEYYSYDRGAICQQMWMIDGAIGEVMETLKSSGLWDTTLVIFTNDNGAASGQGRNLTDQDNDYNYGINWPYRGIKASYYEGGVKTVLAITGGALPSTLKGTVNNDLHHVSDITPTILAAAGWTDEELEGISGSGLDGFPLIETSTASYGKHSYLFLSVPTRASETQYDDNDTAIILENGLKYVTPSDWINKYGYWGTLPVWKSVGTTDDTCMDLGCVWNLTADPYEEIDILGSVSIAPFIDLLKESYLSSDWTAGISFDYAGCDLCSWDQDCTTDTTIGYMGYRYYAPWKDNGSVIDSTN